MNGRHVERSLSILTLGSNTNTVLSLLNVKDFIHIALYNILPVNQSALRQIINKSSKWRQLKPIKTI